MFGAGGGAGPLRAGLRWACAGFAYQERFCGAVGQGFAASTIAASASALRLWAAL
jgi:hypothetical protein